MATLIHYPQCTESSCHEAFAKHHQLRAHICTAHAPPGTKPYRCEHEGCSRSFSTNQKLRTHSKVHDGKLLIKCLYIRLFNRFSIDKRYTCVHPSCLTASSTAPTYYSTWTLLQHHIRTDHPPTCSNALCNGRTFASHHGLRAHLKLHEEREVEAGLELDEDPDDGESADGGPAQPKKRRRGGEMGRDWKCEVDGCGKDFKSVRPCHSYRLAHCN